MTNVIVCLKRQDRVDNFLLFVRLLLSAIPELKQISEIDAKSLIWPSYFFVPHKLKLFEHSACFFTFFFEINIAFGCVGGHTHTHTTQHSSAHTSYYTPYNIQCQFCCACFCCNARRSDEIHLQFSENSISQFFLCLYAQQ